MNALSQPLADPVALANRLAAGFLAAGFKPVPLLTGEKSTRDTCWPERARRGFFQATPTYSNIGLLGDGLRMVDIDIDEALIADKVFKIATEMLGWAPVRSRANSPRKALLYRAAEGEPGKLVVKAGPNKDDWKIEVLGRGQQLHAYGQHPSKAWIKWTDDLVRNGKLVRRDELTSVTETRVIEFLKAASPLIGGGAVIGGGALQRASTSTSGSGPTTDLVAADVSRLAGIVAQIPNDERFSDRNAYVAMAHAIAAAFAEEPELGARLWFAWCAKRPQGDEEDPARVWASIGQDHTVGSEYLVRRAAETGIEVAAYTVATAQAEFAPTMPMPQAEIQKRAIAALTSNLPAVDSLDTTGTEYSDDALALAFAAAHRGSLYYVAGFGKWFYWDGTAYRSDDRLRSMALARVICREAAAGARERHGEALGRRIASAQAVAAVVKLATADPALARSVADFDADPWVLNTPAGIVDLRTGLVRERTADDLVSKATTVAPGGDCPRWLHFLDEITRGDQELVGFLKRFVGYTLTGITTEHAFLFAYGPGGNGKSVLLSTVAQMLGDYATTAQHDVFTACHTDQHPTSLAALRGARMVAVTETEEGRQWAEARVKTITGGDKISARVMRGDPFEFALNCKLWFSGNHKPPLRNPDAAMRRRMNLVPLTYVPAKPDTGLTEALIAEHAGILAWAIEGCLEWQRIGLQPPAIVRDATAEYFVDQDLLAQWLAERCTPEASARTGSAALYADWAVWASARGVPPRGEKWFSPALERHHVKHRSKAGMEFVGISLRPTTADFPIG